MSTFVRCTELDDAHDLLNLAIGLPDNSTGKRMCGVLLRATTVFCWLAIEVTVKSVLDEYYERGYTGLIPKKLSERMMLALALGETFHRILFPESLGGFFRLEGGRREVEDIIRAGLNHSADIEQSLRTVRKNFDLERFKKMRDLRNDLMHVNPRAEELSLKDAKLLFAYAKEMIGDMERKAVVHWG